MLKVKSSKKSIFISNIININIIVKTIKTRNNKKDSYQNLFQKLKYKKLKKHNSKKKITKDL